MASKMLTSFVMSLLITNALVDAGRTCTPSWKTKAIIGVGTFTAAVASSPILDAVGFGMGGIVKNSFAAMTQSMIGSVGKNTIFSKLQRYGMKKVNYQSAAALALWAASQDLPGWLEEALGLECENLL